MFFNEKLKIFCFFIQYYFKLKKAKKMSNIITINTPIGTKICKENGSNSQGLIDEIESISAGRSYHLEIKLKKANCWEKAFDYVIIDTGEKMEKLKLTNKEFIERSMNGESFVWNKFKYFYDETKDSPFRITNLESNKESSLYSAWVVFDGKNEFEVIQPKLKTKIVKEYIYKRDNDSWKVCDILMSELEAKSYFTRSNFFYDIIYQSTGREFEVPDE